MKTFDLRKYLPLIEQSIKYYLDVFKHARYIKNHQIPKYMYNRTRQIKDVYEELLFENNVLMNHDEIREIIVCILFYVSRHSIKSSQQLEFDRVEKKLVKMFRLSDNSDGNRKIQKILVNNQLNLKTMIHVLRL